MSNTTHELVKGSQEGNQDYMLEIIKKFSPLIKKYNRKLNYDGADTDLLIALIETVKSIPIYKDEHLKKEERIIGYISISIKNKYIQLSKKYGNIYNNELLLDIEEIENLNSEINDSLFINQLLDRLATNQKQVIIKKFIKDMSDVEISNDLHISRQAVNKTKNKALKKLKNYLLTDISSTYR